MKCPYCGYIEDRVIDSRPTDEGRQYGEEENVPNA